MELREVEIVDSPSKRRLAEEMRTYLDIKYTIEKHIEELFGVELSPQKRKQIMSDNEALIIALDIASKKGKINYDLPNACNIIVRAVLDHQIENNNRNLKVDSDYTDGVRQELLKEAHCMFIYFFGEETADNLKKFLSEEEALKKLYEIRKIMRGKGELPTILKATIIRILSKKGWHCGAGELNERTLLKELEKRLLEIS